jgi:hypothetical protein
MRRAAVVRTATFALFAELSLYELPLYELPFAKFTLNRFERATSITAEQHFQSNDSNDIMMKGNLRTIVSFGC